MQQENPVRELMQKCLGTHSLVAVVEEDMQTLTAMKDTEGLICFLCTLTKDGRVISQGRGTALLNPSGRFINRTVHSAFNSALADAVIRATKVLDTFRSNDARETAEASQPATDRQKTYLRELVSLKVDDESERERWESQLDALTKEEASSAIRRFAA